MSRATAPEGGFRTSRLLADLRTDEPAGGRGRDAALAVELASLPIEDRGVRLERLLCESLGRVLKIAPERVDRRKPLGSIGVDSLIALEFRRRLEAALGLALPATMIWNYPTVVELAAIPLEPHLRDPAGVSTSSRSRLASRLIRRWSEWISCRTRKRRRHCSPRGGRRMADEARRLTDLSAVKLALLARQARQKLDESGVGGAEPIAVVGMGCRFPGGADDPAKFWRLLADRGDAIREVPADRWPVDALYDPDPGAPGKMTTRWGGFLAAIDGFDPQFFGISPREAARMDPQQRLLLEVAWEALEDAGQTRAGLDGSATGVFVASYHNDYARLLTADRRDIDAWTSTGTAHSIVANRLSYLLNLRGPSLTVDTACSASLVAVHLACRSLRAEECSLAVAGGVSLMLSPEVTISLSKWGFMAADGRCKTFDAKADGFVRGEGCGVVVLKRLSDALADGDRILGLIRGTAVNQDGRTTVLTAPSGLAQAAVIRQALEDGKVAPDQVDYVEAHGTGTVLGDPIEVEALAEMYGKPVGSGHPCVLGAVKANIGHLEAAAGIAGLIKALLCLQHASIPPQCHFTQLNPHLSLEGSRLVIPTEAIAWPRGGRRRLAGVSSFGFGGTNAHVVLEEAPELSVRPASGATPDAVYLLPLSAHREDALIARAESLRAWLESDEVSSVADVCYTAAVRRSHHLHRLAVVGSTAPDLARQLAMHLEAGEAAPAPDRAPRVAFVFSGQGTQRPGMGLELFERRAEFRAALEECDAAIRLRAGWSVIDALRADPRRSQLHRTEVAQPVIFAVQVALARLWDAWGVRPEAVCGHSVGEIAAAFVAGALTLDDAARIAVERGRVMERVTGKGRMVAVNLPASEIEDLLTDDLGLAAVNGPRSVVLSGAPRAVEEAVRRLTERKVRHHVLPVDYAFHSAQLDPLREELAHALSAIRPRPVRTGLFSTVSGRVDRRVGARRPLLGHRDPGAGALRAGDRCAHGRRRDGVRGDRRPARAGRTDPRVSRRAPRPRDRRVLAPPGPRRAGDDADRARRPLPLGCGRAVGPAVSVGRARCGPACVPLAATPVLACSGEWRRGDGRASEPALHPLVHRRVPSPVATLHESRLRAETPRYLGDHRIQGATVLPATGYIEMALMVGGGSPVEDLVITAPLHVPDGEERLVQIVLGEGRTMQVYSATSGPEPRWTLHATARLGSAPAAPDAEWASTACRDDRRPGEPLRDPRGERPRLRARVPRRDGALAGSRPRARPHHRARGHRGGPRFASVPSRADGRVPAGDRRGGGRSNAGPAVPAVRGGSYRPASGSARDPGERGADPTGHRRRPGGRRTSAGRGRPADRRSRRSPSQAHRGDSSEPARTRRSWRSSGGPSRAPPPGWPRPASGSCWEAEAASARRSRHGSRLPVTASRSSTPTCRSTRWTSAAAGGSSPVIGAPAVSSTCAGSTRPCQPTPGSW